MLKVLEIEHSSLSHFELHNIIIRLSQTVHYGRIFARSYTTGRTLSHPTRHRSISSDNSEMIILLRELRFYACNFS